MTATCDQVLVAVRASIVAAGLTGVSSANIVDMLVGDDQGGTGPQIPGYPCVVCCYAGQGESNEGDGGTNLTDDWVYPVSVVLLASENQDQVTNRARNLLWRDVIKKQFHKKRMPGVTNGSAWNCDVRPGTIADRPRWLENQHAQVFVIAVTVREGR